MKIARVIGSLVATVKHPDHVGCKLMFVGPIDSKGRQTDPAFIAIDAAQAGVGDYVLVVEEGKSARQVLGSESAPCEAIIVGVIDQVRVRGERLALEAPAGEGAHK